MKKILFLALLPCFLAISCQKESLSPADSEVAVNTSSSKKSNKVDICHYSKDDNTWKVLSVNASSLAAHTAHGDAVDMDGDGYFNAQNGCTAIDCNDGNPNENPGQQEIPYDGIDNDCDPATPDDDLDGDGYNLSDDCADDNPNVNPGATEECSDGIDNNCDGLTDDEDTDACGVVAEVGDTYEGGIVFYVSRYTYRSEWRRNC